MSNRQFIHQSNISANFPCLEPRALRHEPWALSIGCRNRMQGWESVCWLVIGIPLRENRKVGSIYHIFVSCFWSKWNSYPSCWRNSAGKMKPRKFLVFDFSSFPRIHHFYLSKIQEFNISEIQKNGHLRFPKFRNSWVSEIFEKSFPIFPGMFPDCFLI